MFDMECFCRSTSNYNNAEEDQVEQESSVSVSGNGVETVTPVEGNEGEVLPVTTPPAVPGTSSDTSIAGPSRLHIQKPKAKRLTEAAKQRQELTTSFISLLQKEQEQDFQQDDEVDATFAALANIMWKHLNPDQLEDVLQEVNHVVTQAINNVRSGVPAVRQYVTPPPLQPVQNLIPLAQDQQGPPAMTAAPSVQQQATHIPAPSAFQYSYDDIM